MRTTITLDDDVAALIESERARTGESFRAVVNRLLRRGARAGRFPTPPPLPELPGRPILDVSDVSALLAALDEGRRAERALP
ncbi:MAG TPA: hypothetical protein VFD49_22660 [Candidatus Dormibacteraeota bacterium]|nr:hypothetical protein [Candidatus Dormibacteraeota bacterium]